MARNLLAKNSAAYVDADLEKLIRASGVTNQKLAERLSMTPQGVWKKRRNLSFSLSDAVLILDEIGADDKDKLRLMSI